MRKTRWYVLEELVRGIKQGVSITFGISPAEDNRLIVDVVDNTTGTRKRIAFDLQSVSKGDEESEEECSPLWELVAIRIRSAVDEIKESINYGDQKAKGAKGKD